MTRAPGLAVIGVLALAARARAEATETPYHLPILELGGGLGTDGGMGEVAVGYRWGTILDYWGKPIRGGENVLLSWRPDAAGERAALLYGGEVGDPNAFTMFDVGIEVRDHAAFVVGPTAELRRLWWGVGVAVSGGIDCNLRVRPRANGSALVVVDVAALVHRL